MKKKIFKDNYGNIHFGAGAPEGFQGGGKEDAANALASLGERKLWRCTVCNDLRIAVEPLKECPTCDAHNAYIQIELKEFSQLIETLWAMKFISFGNDEGLSSFI